MLALGRESNNSFYFDSSNLSKNTAFWGFGLITLCFTKVFASVIVPPGHFEWKKCIHLAPPEHFVTSFGSYPGRC